MKINKVNYNSLKLIKVTYEEYVEWAISNHLMPSKKSTLIYFHELIRKNKLVRNNLTKQLQKRSEIKEQIGDIK